MNHLGRTVSTAVLGIVLSSSALSAQTLHTNDRWEDCSFVIAPALTQQAWRQFVNEVGLVMYFRPLADAKPLGAKHVEFSLLRWSTEIDDATPAWNDTFSHPDSAHYLFDGDALPLPGLMLRVGVTDRIDAATYITKNPNANYGVAGGQLQYSLGNGALGKFDAAGRVSGAVLFGPEDLNATVVGLDFVVSRDVSFLSPYAGVSGYLSSGQETTSKVNLENENVVGARGTLRCRAEHSRAECCRGIQRGQGAGILLQVRIRTLTSDGYNTKRVTNQIERASAETRNNRPRGTSGACHFPGPVW